MPEKRSSLINSLPVYARVLVLLVAVVVVGTSTAVVRADSYDEKINALKAQNSRTQDGLDNLELQAKDYKTAISLLADRISTVEKSIAANEAKQAELQRKIVAKRKEIARQRVVLGDVLRSMYVDGQMSTIEMLATSNDLSDFVDKEAYRNSVQAKIQEALAHIAKLQKQLQAQQTEVKQLIASQEKQQEQLAENRRRQASLLAYNERQQTEYNNKLKENSKRIAELQAKQAAAEAALARSLNSGSYRTAPVGWVNAGTAIGAIGSTGLSSGPHLHLEVRAGGVRKNPSPYIKSEPVNRPPAWISQGYGVPNRLYASGYHTGIDYAAAEGSPIFAIDSGNMYRGCSDQMLGTRNNAYGYVAIVEHRSGAISIYAHMSGGPSACNYNTYY